MLTENVGDDTLAHGLNGFRDVFGFQQFIALLVDHLALVVGHIIIFQQLLADIEVARFNFTLRRLQRTRDERMLDRLAFRHLQLVHDGAQALTGKDAQQLVVKREVEARGTGIALTPGTTAQLVVDAARLMALGADDVQPPRSQHLLMHPLPFILHFSHFRGFGLGTQRIVGQHRIDILLDIAPQHDVRTPARHVGGNGDHARAPGLCHDLGFTGVLFGIEHLVRQLFLVEQGRQQFGVFDRGGPHQHGLPTLRTILDIRNDRCMLFVRRLIDEVVHVLARHRAVGRNHHRFQPINLLELIGFGIGRAGHARQFAVHAEVVLEGDRGQRLVFRLDRHPFLRFHRLVQTIRPAPAAHQTPGEFIDNDDFTVLHHIVLILVEQGEGAQGRIQVVHQGDVGGVVQAAPFDQHPGFRQQLLGALVTAFGEVHLVAFFVHPVITLALFFHGATELRHHFLHPHVEIGVIVSLTGDDQRRTRFVDEDGVHLIHDGVVEAALYALLLAVHHVVTQVIETEFVVRAIGDIGGIGGLLRLVIHLRQIHPDRKAEKTVQTPHPFSITTGKIIVHRDDMHALTRNRIQVGRQGGNQRLALTGAHFGDFAVVQDHAADQLHIEMTHSERPLARFTHDGKRFRQQRIKAFARRMPATELIRLGTQRGVVKRLHLWFQGVDLLDCLGILLD